MSAKDRKDYWKDIEDYAREIINDEGLDEENWNEAVSTTVDGSSWIIYYANHETVLEQTNNEPDNDDVAAMAPSKGGWREMRQTAALLAMEGDLYDKLQEIKDEYFTCDECDETKRTEDQVEGHDLCTSCALVCSKCDYSFPKDDNQGAEDAPVCENCADNEE